MKRVYIVCFVLIFIICLGGCNSASSSKITDTSASSKYETDLSNSTPIVLIRDEFTHNTGMGNGVGYYSLLQNEDMTTNILYMDYKTKEQVYLCERPECLHNDSTCNSWLGTVYGGANIFVVDNTLLIVQWGSANLANDYGEIALPTFYTANLDGSDRKMCIRLDATEQLEGGLAYSGRNLYFVINNLSVGDGLEGVSSLVCVNLDTKEEHVIYDFDRSAYLQSAFDNYLVIKTLSSIKWEEIEDETDLESASNSIEMSALVIDRNGNLVNEVSWKNGNAIGRCFNDKLYQLNLSTKMLKEIFLLDGKEKEICTVDFEFAKDSITINQKTNNFLIIQTINETTFDHYAVNCETGEIISLPLKYKERNLLIPVEIWDEYDNYYYVCGNSIDSGRGFSYPQNALILKSDFWSGNGNYIWMNNIA